MPKRRGKRVTCAVALAAGNIDPATVGQPQGSLAVVGIGPGAPNGARARPRLSCARRRRSSATASISTSPRICWPAPRSIASRWGRRRIACRKALDLAGRPDTASPWSAPAIQHLRHGGAGLRASRPRGQAGVAPRGDPRLRPGFRRFRPRPRAGRPARPRFLRHLALRPADARATSSSDACRPPPKAISSPPSTTLARAAAPILERPRRSFWRHRPADDTGDPRPQSRPRRGAVPRHHASPSSRSDEIDMLTIVLIGAHHPCLDGRRPTVASTPLAVMQKSGGAAMTVYFIGAGPGAPDLITVRGLRPDRAAARSAFMPARSCRPKSSPRRPRAPGCSIPRRMHLDEIIAEIAEAHAERPGRRARPFRRSVDLWRRRRADAPARRAGHSL